MMANIYLKVASMNVGGLHTLSRLRTVARSLEKEKSDVIFIQETHLSDSTISRLSRHYSGQIFHSPGTSASGGVAILVKKSLQIGSPTFVETDPLGKFIHIQFTHNDHNYHLTNVYAPSGGNIHIQRARDDMFTLLAATLPTPDKEDIVILGGDFNMTVYPQDREYTPKQPYKCISQQGLKILLSALKVEDTWRILNPKTRQFTCKSSKWGTHTRLDRLYVSTSIRCEVTIYHQPFLYSDHINSVNAVIGSQPRGHDHWHFNNTLTEDEKYATLLTQWWEEWRTMKREYAHPRDWWEDGKLLIKINTTEYCTAQRKKQRKHIQSLLKRLRNLQNKSNPKNFTHITQALRQKLRAHEQEQAESARVRAKIQWEEEGERCSKFFFSLEKKQQASRAMNALRTPDGKIVTDQAGILAEAGRFYHQLYSAENIDREALENMLSKITKKISPDSKAKCDSPISLKELTQALKGMPNGKSPGTDGLTVEFYKRFWDILGEDLLLSLQSGLEEKLLSESQRSAIITCLYKKGDRHDLGNWRPISLLNIDYKVLTKTLANKMTTSLEEVIHPNQSASVPGRTILTNISAVRDLIQHAADENLPAALISIDQAKAFDRVNWVFLFKTLKAFGYGETFINNIKTLYTQIKSQIKINGTFSEPFNLSRGVRQGCPLSMILYALLGEVFANFINIDPNIHGINIGEEEVKITQHADDTNFFLTRDDSITTLSSHLDVFQKATGAKINLSKCEGLWLGTNRGRQDTPLGFNWNSNKIKVLGVVLANPEYNASTDNWDKCETKIKSTIRTWSKARLSLRGRRLIINQLVLSQVWFPRASSTHTKGSAETL